MDVAVGLERGIVRQPLLDHMALVAEANDEIVDPVVAIHLHDMPEDRAAADLDQRLRPGRRILADPRSSPARQYDCFHRIACPFTIDGQTGTVDSPRKAG